MIHCDPSQLRLLVKARSCEDGQGIVCKLTAGAACVWALVPAIQNQECQVALPCPGDQSRAAAQDNELIFAIPTGRQEDVVLGLRYLGDQGYGFPQVVTLMPEYELLESYVKIGKMMGMEWLR